MNIGSSSVSKVQQLPCSSQPNENSTSSSSIPSFSHPIPLNRTSAEFGPIHQQNMYPTNTNMPETNHPSSSSNLDSAHSNSSTNPSKADSFEGDDAAEAIAAMLHANHHLSHQPLPTNSQHKQNEIINSSHPTFAEKLQDTSISTVSSENTSLSSLVGQQQQQQQDIYNTLPQENTDYVVLRNSPSHPKPLSRDGIPHDVAQRLAKSFQDAENSLDIVAAQLSKAMSNSTFGEPFLSRFNSLSSFIRAANKTLQDRVLASNYGEINMFDLYTSAVQSADLVSSDLSLFVENNVQHSVNENSHGITSGDGVTNSNNSNNDNNSNNNNNNDHPNNSRSTKNTTSFYSPGLNATTLPLLTGTSDSSSALQPALFQQPQKNPQLGNPRYPLPNNQTGNTFFAISRSQDQVFPSTAAATTTNTGNNGLTASYPPSRQISLNEAPGAKPAISRAMHASSDSDNYRFVNTSLKPNSCEFKVGSTATSSVTPQKARNNEEDIMLGLPEMASGSSPGNYFLPNDGQDAVTRAPADVPSSSSSSSRDSIRQPTALQYQSYIPIVSATAEEGSQSSESIQLSPNAEDCVQVINVSRAGRHVRNNSGNRTSGLMGVSTNLKPVYTNDGTEIPQYRMSRDISTLQEMVREWYEGLDGGPSVRQLEAQYGSKWRTKNDAERVFLGRRKVIINKIEESIRASNGKRTFDDIVEEMEDERKRLKKSIDGLGRYYNQVSAKEKHVQAIQQERATAAAVAAAVAAATAQHRTTYDPGPQVLRSMAPDASTSDLASSLMGAGSTEADKVKVVFQAGNSHGPQSGNAHGHSSKLNMDTSVDPAFFAFSASKEELASGRRQLHVRPNRMDLDPELDQTGSEAIEK